jgi:hypothetical protein
MVLRKILSNGKNRKFDEIRKTQNVAKLFYVANLIINIYTQKHFSKERSIFLIFLFQNL